MRTVAELYFGDHSVSGEVGRLAVRGGIISVVGGYGSAALQLIAAVVLARLLTPDDFGVVAIITALTSFAPLLIDFGMADATIQRSRITPGQVSSLLWISCAIGLAVAGVLAGCSSLIASVYHDPRLRSIALYSALTFALSGLSGQHLSLLRRALQFATVAKIQFVAAGASLLIAIALALCGAGYWALVVRPISNAGFVTVGAWLACRWRPGMPTFDGEVKSMIAFGLHVVGFGITYSFSRALDRLGLGLFYGAQQVGYYQNASTLYDNSIFSALSQLHNVGAAALSRLQSDHSVLREKYTSALSMTAFFMMPAAGVLSVIAPDLIPIVLGPQWRPTGALLAILALRGVFQVIEGSQGWLHLSLGRADRWKNWGVLTAVVQAGAVACGIPFGTTGVAVAVTATSALIALPSISYAGRPGGVGVTMVVRAIHPQFLGTATCIAAGWLAKETVLQQFDGIWRITASVVLCAAVYLLIVVGVFRLFNPLGVILRLIHQLR